MDGDGVNPDPSEMAGEEQPPPQRKTFTEIFWEVLPYYLSIGMTWDQFWHGDVRMAVAFRKAEEMRIDRKNAELWLQGMYVYEAVCDASPIFNPFAKKNTRPKPYPAQPYETKRTKKTNEELQAKREMDKAQKMMDTFATKFNARFKQKPKSQEVNSNAE